MQQWARLLCLQPRHAGRRRGLLEPGGLLRGVRWLGRVLLRLLQLGRYLPRVLLRLLRRLRAMCLSITEPIKRLLVPADS